MNKLKSHYEEWLETGTETQKRHARYLLAKDSDAANHQPAESPLQYPTLVEQARNALTAIVRAAESSFACVDKVELDQRLAICRACEFWDPARHRCSKCGCFGAFKAKQVAEHCPVGKW